MNNCEFLLSKNPVFLKRTGQLGKWRYWFWNPTLQQVTGTQGQPKPPRTVSDNAPTYSYHPFEMNRSFQVGDIVFDFLDFQFCVLITEPIDNKWKMVSRSGEHVDRHVRDIELVSGNVVGTTRVTDECNLIGAITEAELAYAELLGFERANAYLKARLPNVTIGEKTMLELHMEVFGDIYQWGGRYREEDVVVGRRDSPTVLWQEVPSRVSTFFRSFRNPLLRRAHESRQHLLEALVELHRELAAIHPFKDGNGRIIRMLCEILALEWGYELRWDFTGVGKVRRYHDAVRRAVHNGDNRYLRNQLNQRLYDPA